MAMTGSAHQTGIRLAIAIVILLALIPQGIAGQDAGTPRLTITDRSGTATGTFDVIAEPGDSVTIPIQFRAAADRPIEVRAWLANVSSGVNGGIVVAGAGAASGAPASWISYPDETVVVDPGQPLDRPVAVRVPDSAQPGVYVAAIVIEASEPVPIADSDATEIVRATALVAIQVPGAYDASFDATAPTLVQHGRANIVQVAVENTGTVPVFPAGTMTLEDESGKMVAELPVRMGAVFAGTSTVLEADLSPLPPAGTYTLTLELADPDTGASARIDDGELVVPEGLSEPEPGTSGDPATPEPTMADAPARAEIAFEHASVRADNDPLLSVYVEASILNTGSPVESARLVLVATRRGQVVEEAVVADRVSLATGVTSISTRYAPEDGFASGIWTFSLRLESVAEDGTATTLAQTGTIAKIDLA